MPPAVLLHCAAGIPGFVSMVYITDLDFHTYKTFVWMGRVQYR